MTEKVFDIAGWRCTDAGLSRSAVSLASGVGFACSRRGGLWAIDPSRVPIQPSVLAWLVYPVFDGLVSSDDLEDAPSRLWYEENVR